MVTEWAATPGSKGTEAVKALLDEIYEMVRGQGGRLREIPSLPYTEGHGPSKVFGSNMVADERSAALLKSIHSALRMGDEVVPEGRLVQAEGGEFGEEVAKLQAKEKRLTDEYGELAGATNLAGLGAPTGDYGTFLRTRVSLAGPIRNLRNGLGSVLNTDDDDDDSTHYQSGRLDTQLAIQVVASGQKRRNDVFTRYAPSKMNESWCILIDSSKSLSGFGQEVRSIATCLAEAANMVIQDPNNWGLFSFNSTFQVLKDFGEPYNLESKARIGGMQQEELTYLPDAIEVCYQRIRAAHLDNSVIVVVTDGHPVGYSGIEKRLVEVLKTVSKSGIPLIGIGLESKEIKKYFKNSCIIDNPYRMMKFFVQAYSEDYA